MPYGAHETMEAHEILMEKINMISHFSLYARSARNPQLRDMIARHSQEAVRSYNDLVSLTRNNTRFTPVAGNTVTQGISPEQVQYGLRNPQQMAPQTDATLSDQEIACAMLLCHKNGAKNAMAASLECADPNVRRALVNSAVTCNNQAYEVFLLLNQQGVYQVPTLNDHTAQTFLHSYQPVGAGAGVTQFAAPMMGTGVPNVNLTNTGFMSQGQMWQ
jgi:spore coat protein CotF